MRVTSWRNLLTGGQILNWPHTTNSWGSAQSSTQISLIQTPGIKTPLAECGCVALELDTNRGASQGDSDELISSQRRAWSTYNHFPFFACVYYSPDFEHSLVECIIFPAFVDLGFCLRVGIFNLHRLSHLAGAIRSLQGEWWTNDNNW